ncbi:hypothetical protein [Streptomyces sp. NRRL B-24572]|nr:hypothetical protein [Streptomyces sp. NRRL B-24572]
MAYGFTAHEVAAEVDVDEMREVLAKVLTFGREEARPRLIGFPV